MVSNEGCGPMMSTSIIGVAPRELEQHRVIKGIEVGPHGLNANHPVGHDLKPGPCITGISGFHPFPDAVVGDIPLESETDRPVGLQCVGTNVATVDQLHEPPQVNLNSIATRLS